MVYNTFPLTLLGMTLGLVLLSGEDARAGMVLEYQVTDGPHLGETYLIQLDQRGLAVQVGHVSDSSSQKSKHKKSLLGRFGYQAGKRSYWLQDDENQSYVEFSHDELMEMSESLTRKERLHVRQLRAKMDGMSEEKKKQLGPKYQELKDSLLETETEIHMAQTQRNLVIKSLSTKKKVNRWNCSNYELLDGTMRKTALCHASIKEMEIKPADFALLKELAAQIEKFDPDGKVSMAFQFERLPAGITVEMIHSRNGDPQQQQTIQLSKISREELAQIQFNPPKKYKKLDRLEYIRQLTFKKLKNQ